MVNLFGHPLLFRQLDTFEDAGIKNVLLVGGYYADALKIAGIDLVINPRFADTNMVYSLFCAEPNINPSEDLIISYGDIVFEPEVLQSLLRSNAPLNIVIDTCWQKLWLERMSDPLADAETLKLESGNKIIELGKKPESYADIEGQYIGLIKIRADHVQAFLNTWHAMDRDLLYDGKSFENMYMTSFLQHLINTGWDARAVFIENGWLEVDTVEDLEHYEQLEARDQLKKYYHLKKTILARGN